MSIYSGDEDCSDDATSDPANIDGHTDECEAAACALVMARLGGNPEKIAAALADLHRAADCCPICSY